jgi:hypothetical protein
MRWEVGALALFCCALSLALTHATTIAPLPVTGKCPIIELGKEDELHMRLEELCVPDSLRFTFFRAGLQAGMTV